MVPDLRKGWYMDRRKFCLTLIPWTITSPGNLLYPLHANAADPPKFDEQRLYEFHALYNAFIRKLLACPEGAKDVEECFPARGVMDAELWEKCCEKGKRLFG